MNKKKLERILRSGTRVYFALLLLFALAGVVFGQYELALGELVATGLFFLYERQNEAHRRREILKYVDLTAANLEGAGKETMLNAPLPMVIFRPETDEVIWSNDRFLRLANRRERLFDTKLSVAVPGFTARWLLEGKDACPEEIAVGGHRYLVVGNLVHSKDSSDLLATTFWLDVTELSRLRGLYRNSRPAVALLLLDNYDEVLKNLADNTRSAILSEISSSFSALAEEHHGLLTQLDRDRYLLVFEADRLQQMVKEKFPILDAVHRLCSPNGTAVTLSVGVGFEGDSFQELYQYASLSVEMALSRGGDQAVVKNKTNFEFYGGRAKELEKRTKVKSRVMANTLGILIDDASKVFIMGHRQADLDAIGAAAGVFALARKRGRQAYILREENPVPAQDMYNRLGGLVEYEGCFVYPQDALLLADANSLLVVVDTNRPEQVQSEELLLSCNRVAVIDHHRRAATYIANAVLNFHEPYASSASELVTELLQYILEPADLLRAEAEALLSGIVLDTKHFTMRTGGRTFEAAAFLRRAGADPREVQQCFQSDLDSTVQRYRIIQEAKMYRNGVAIAVARRQVGRITAAQAADELLNISGVDASVILFPMGEEMMLSARSSGEINVQLILEKLGGGGNANVAGAQLSNTTLEEAEGRLHAAIDQYFENA